MVSVDPEPPAGQRLLAPPTSGSSSALRLPGESESTAWPRVDDHLVTPETREELVRGRKMVAVPANPPHGKQHFALDYVLGAHISDGYQGATELLTRVGPDSNFATDTCIFRKGIDPSTGARWLEELAFEIVAEQSMRDITERAEDLSARGVRRLIAIFVKKGEVCEWLPSKGQWRVLGLDSELTDPTLRRPLKVRALLDAAEADNAVVEALKAKGNPRLAELEAASRREGRRKGREAGLRRSIDLVCARLEIPLSDEQRAQLEDLDAAALESLLDRLLAERRWPQ